MRECREAFSSWTDQDEGFRIKDVKHCSCGFTKCENMRRRLLLAFRYPPLQKGGVPLPNRNE